MAVKATPPGPLIPADLDSAAAWIDQLFELPSDARWLLLEAGGERSEEYDVEARLAIGNGAFGMRASLEQPHPGGQAWSVRRRIVRHLGP